MKKYLNLAAVALLVITFTGCSSSVSRPDSSSSDVSAPNLAGVKVKDVNVSLSPKAKEKLADNLKFDQNMLKDHIVRVLDANDLTSEESTLILDLIVTNIRVRSNFSAVMFGFMAGADNISGEVKITDTDNTIDKFDVKVSYALGGFAGGMDGARMGWMYETFAKKIIEEWTGKKKNRKR